MCGILVAISRDAPSKIDEVALELLQARGPDSLQIHISQVDVNDGLTRYLSFVSTVLSLRGHSVQTQPLIDPITGSVLCWNGEAWKFGGNPVFNNDSQHIFQCLLQTIADCEDAGRCAAVRSEAIVAVLTSVAGPYAVVFYDAKAANLYYARDPLGRRSLIANISDNKDHDPVNPTQVIISSFDTTFQGFGNEVSTSGVQLIDLKIPKVAPKLLTWPRTSLDINKAIPSTDQDISKIPTSSAVEALGLHLSTSVAIRVRDIPTYNNTSATTNSPSRVAILFSGGIDCTLLARLSHDVLPPHEPIDLLNVAFENPRTVRAAALTRGKSKDEPVSPYEVCPDRVTGRSSFSELCANYPSRSWRFIAINIPYTEMLEHKPAIIRLMRPHNTEMDLSIAMALYFAAKGTGTIHTQTSGVGQEYTTTARVLLSGLGADELFGGYSRHMAAFSRGGFEALNDELELDFTRIGTRNLGRDDRVIAHWSREVRYPFLDEDFVKFALQLPSWEKVGFREGQVLPKHFEENANKTVNSVEDLDPAKMILRCLMWELGMKKVANEKKRAIQFGARTAKMEGGRTKGTDILSAT